MTLSPQPPPCRRRARILATRSAGLPAWATDLDTVRERCMGRRCRSRWGVVRVSIDLRSRDAIDRVATVECAVCGRVWRRTRADRPLTRSGAQRVLLTLLLPSSVNRWYARGRWHVTGSDAVELRNATLADADEAARDWRRRHDQYLAAKDRVRAKREAAATEAHERTTALLARLAAKDAERRLEEAAATERDLPAFDYASAQPC